MRTRIIALLSEDPNKYVSMCHGLFCYRLCSQVPHLRICH
jgi:hypothetical protein